MKFWLWIFFSLFFFTTASAETLTYTERNSDSYVALCYHDFIDVSLTPNMRIPSGTLTRDRLVEHFNWIKQEGYNPVSFQQIIDAKASKKPLPEKAVLLTFDDGYESFYSTVYPLLKLYNYPAVFALVGKWLVPDEDQEVKYGKIMLSRKRFLSWAHIKELEQSGLVEFASHTFNSHYGINANPYGNEQPAATTPFFNPKTKDYETLKQYDQRNLSDFKQSRDQMVSHNVRAPRIMVWPYGAYSQHAIDIAAQAGMPYTFSLDDGVNSIKASGHNIKRYLIEQEMTLELLDELLRGEPDYTRPKRIVHVDLDYVYDPDPVVMNRNMDILVSRINDFGIDTVYLQAFADPDGDGVADAMYFQNRHLPVRADIFNRVSWQLLTRANVTVYAGMPVIGFDLGKGYDYVIDSRSNQPAADRYLRLSPFSAKSRKAIKEIYEDLGFYSKFQGILFHDDAFLTDYEDASPAAIKQYQEWGLGDSVDAIRHDPAKMTAWAKHKTRYLVDFTMELANSSRLFHSGDGIALQLARNIYAPSVLNPKSEEWFAQNLTAFSKAYDYTAVMATPYMEPAKEPHKWLESIAKVALKTVPNDKLVFELQAKNWENGQDIPVEELIKQMDIIDKAGVKNYGYYPDDFIRGVPDLNVIRPVFSNRETIGFN
ncbi:poly-beta-1,6-N-acetyl-D-glucosamine N-deacetylase PgaB [Photobacterium sagamiensis]|uniref:poly-beta-1,6-N-acetyl-D-glucosamine N-deacetylase PgaB n=1 Tax=Photobacterium sagamiensis TaxID=2910241 RepID=UPI003D126760